jgi:hypothetical protein
MTRDDFVGRTALALAIGSVGLVILTAAALASPKVREAFGFAAPTTTGYAIGDRLDGVPPELLSGRGTLLLFARRNCSACQSSKGPLTTLIVALRKEGIDTVVVAGLRDAAGDADYAGEVGVAPARVLARDPKSFQVKLVPSLVLVDRDGTVRYSRTGVVTDQEVSAIARALPPLLQ